MQANSSFFEAVNALRILDFKKNEIKTENTCSCYKNKVPMQK